MNMKFKQVCLTKNKFINNLNILIINEFTT